MSSSHETHSHGTHLVERHCDVCVVGGSAAGLAAALQLGRQRRSVIVVDSGEPRNRPAAHMHSYLSREGLPPAELIAVAREEVRSYGGEVLANRVSQVSRTEAGDFRVELASGHAIIARRVLTATDLPDELPDIDDVQAAGRPSANQADWDHRYAGPQMWSGNPNGTLVNEVSGLAPGRALDVGAGEGGDALWLAAQGWTVTASDISVRALDRISAEAGRRGLRVDCQRADANALAAYETAAFDLVSAAYASIPRTPDDRAVRGILNAVAPGGTLLIVGHDLEPMRAPGGAPKHGDRPFDPDAYVRVDDFAAALASSPAWDIELHEKRPRPAGAASAAHHVDDIVLRARRRD
jgi:SAM-dependent methyltransferase